MKRSLFLFFLLWIGFVYVAGILLFIGGFLLTRETLSDVSTTNRATPLFRRAIVLIIDAFKYEFATFNEHDGVDEKPYLNKFPVSQRLQADRYGVLLEVLADPPTTTLQRLKGLTTGSLPTFIDLSNNFHSSVIEEDNWVDQLRSNNKSIVFAGDDTWMGLYPDRFLRSYPYPSFNIRDLDTVDRGVVRALRQELGKTDWDVFIGHFLGVDHVGHTYGPNHFQMSKKLTEMDKIVRNVSDFMADDTVLFVLGDHGMTRTGDHGGDSREELSSALLIYNKKYRLLSSPSLFEDYSQIDFVPTMCLWMGLPIPFSNLGTFLPIIDNDNYNHDYLKNNVQQVMQYLNSMQGRNKFSKKSMTDLARLFTDFKSKQKSVMNASEIRHLNKLGFEILNLAKRMCQSVWAKFHLTPMGAGLTVIFIHTSILILLVLPETNLARLIDIRLVIYLIGSSLMGAVLGASLSVFLNDMDLLLLFILGTASASSLMIFGFVSLWRLRKSIFRRFETSFSLFDTVMVAVTLTTSLSNSYVVEESYVLHFVTVTLLATTLLSTTTFPMKSMVIFTSFLLRLSNVYFRCREEQETNWNCTTVLHFHKAIGTLSSDVSRSLKNWRFFSTISSVFIIVVASNFWLKKCGNLNGISPTVSLINYVPSAVGICMISYWALQGLPAPMVAKLLPWQQNILAQTAFLLLVATVIVVVYRPSFVYLVTSHKHEMPKLYDDGGGVTSYFRFLKTNWRRHFSVGTDQYLQHSRVAYGLGTSLSAPILSVVLCLSLASMLILGDGLCPSVAILLWTMACILTLNAIYARGTSEGVNGKCVYLWWLCQKLFFYVSGHQPTFPTIQWDAAFVGFTGADNRSWDIIPVLLVSWNTFQSRILFGISLPLLFLSPYTLSLVSPSITSAFSDDGESALLENGWETAAEARILKLILKYVVLCGLEAFSSMFSAAVLRRHLMVWKIFAPKFIFEGLGFFVSFLSVLLGYLLWNRVYRYMALYYSQLRLR